MAILEAMADHLAFYRELTPFRDFSELANSKVFARVPDEWCVLIADIKGSTQAVREGRHKDVSHRALKHRRAFRGSLAACCRSRIKRG